MLPRKHCNEMFDSKEASFVAITINNFPTAERQRAMEVTLVASIVATAILLFLLLLLRIHFDQSSLITRKREEERKGGSGCAAKKTLVTLRVVARSLAGSPQ